MIPTNKLISQFYASAPIHQHLGCMTFCSQVYLPIGLMELDIVEASVEEFDTIEWIILRLIYNGVKQPAEIGKLMGISESYVWKIFRILEGYNHILNGELTENGKRSAMSTEKVKYLEHSMKLLVQISPNFGLLLTNLQRQNELLTPPELNYRYGIMQTNATIEKEMLDRLKKDLKPFKKAESSVLHVNAQRVTSIRSKDLKYTTAYLCTFEHYEKPTLLIVARSQKNGQLRLVPIALEEEHPLLTILNEPITILPKQYFTQLEEYKNKLDKESRLQSNFPYYHLGDTQNKFGQYIQRRLDEYLGFYSYGVKWSRKRSLARIDVKIKDILYQQGDYWFGNLFYFDYGPAPIPFLDFGLSVGNGGLVTYLMTSEPLLQRTVDKVQTVFKNPREATRFYQSHKSKIDQLGAIEHILEFLVEEMSNLSEENILI